MSLLSLPLRPHRLSTSTPLLPFLYPRSSPSNLHLPPLLLPKTLSRPASHAAEGRANGAKNGPGKRLGAKRGATELVVPGNIIFRQRGTHWFPGENCGMGRDHTIFAREKGYVCFYSDEERYPGRKYIGVVFERGQSLPVGRGEKRRRRLGMWGREMSSLAGLGEGQGQGHLLLPDSSQSPEEAAASSTAESTGDDNNKLFNTTTTPPTIIQQPPKEQPEEEAVPPQRKAQIKLQKNYSYREANWEIGRAAEYAGVQVEKYNRKDRFRAWRKRTERRKEEMEKKALRGQKKRQRKGSSK